MDYKVIMNIISYESDRGYSTPWNEPGKTFYYIYK